ncbi:histidine phosphatase family protein [Aneurinibacillus terranovensis]|uniref:histidine phosphatase family protein n=1 Tax=Aneurinibacillus terranovensis TaxID=278991 RepID=UPI0004104594|nr:histidine phosphatase family protein [Aneurinibacillus terranovensis]
MDYKDNVRNIYLIRHGETDWNVQRRVQGHSDIPLNKRGIEQANRLAKHLKGESIDYICSSDLERAYHTAEIIANETGLSVHKYMDLRERNYGVWEGKDYETIRSVFADVAPQNPSNERLLIESFSELQERGMNCIQTILQANEAKHIVLVSHGGMINALLHKMSNGRYGPGITKLRNTSINHIGYQGTCWVVHRVNDDSHLDDEMM